MVDLHDHLIGYSPDIKEDITAARLHDLVHSYLSRGYAVIYAAESDVTYSPREDTIGEQKRQKTYTISENLARHIGSSRVKRYLQRGLLTITDPNSILPADASMKQLLRSMNSYIEDCESRAPEGIEGKVFFNSPINFFQKEKFNKFLEFEHTIGTRFHDNNFQMVCWYKKSWIQSLSFSQLVRLLASHNRSIHNNLKFQTWNTDKTIEVISEGINKALKQDHASNIIFETMRRRFNLDRSTIISSPNLFADTLRIMSPDSAVSLIDTIKAHVENRLSYVNNNRGKSRKVALLKKKGKGLQRRSTSSTSKENRSNTDNNRTLERKWKINK